MQESSGAEDAQSADVPVEQLHAWEGEQRVCARRGGEWSVINGKPYGVDAGKERKAGESSSRLFDVMSSEGC